MTDPRFSARRWELEHAETWREWTAGASTSRIHRASVLSRAVVNLTARWASGLEDASRVVSALPGTLGRCNELSFSSEFETLAYTIWHLTDRYARIMNVLDELLLSGHLPLRKVRLSALEIGAGPSPALQAIKDFYLDLSEWAGHVDSEVALTPATHLLSLDRGSAWSHLVHALAEEQWALGDAIGPHSFNITYSEFQAFSVRGEHRKALDRIARAIVSDGDTWDEYIEDSVARSQAASSHDYPPGAMDFVVLCNFLTEAEMTRAFAEELAELAESLTPGGVLLVLGSAASTYGPIFGELRSLVTRSGTLRQVFDIVREAPHPDPRMREAVSRQIVDCLSHCRSMSPDDYLEIATKLPADVRSLGSSQLDFPRYRAAAFKGERPYSPRRGGRARR